jgi:hypothetical protein
LILLTVENLLTDASDRVDDDAGLKSIADSPVFLKNITPIDIMPLLNGSWLISSK